MNPSLGGRREIKVVVTCCRHRRTDCLMYIKLCYVEHNTVSPAASGRQHVTTTFIYLLPPSELYCFCLQRIRSDHPHLMEQEFDDSKK